MTAIKATEIIEVELSHIPMFERILKWDIRGLAREFEEIDFVKKIECKGNNGMVTVKIKGYRYAEVIHPYVEKTYPCPLVSLVLLVLKKDIMVLIAGSLPTLTEDSVIMKFRIAKPTKHLLWF